MSYVIKSPSGLGTLYDFCGPFDSEREARDYADENYYSDPRWSPGYEIILLRPPTWPDAFICTTDPT